MLGRIAFVLLTLVLAAGELGSGAAQAQSAPGQTAPGPVSPPASTLKIFPPPGGGIAWRGEPIRIGVSVGGANATNVRLVRSMLREADSFRTLDFQLCLNERAPCREPSILRPGEARDLYLRARAAVTPGNYTGTFVISSSEKPDGETFDMSLYYTSGWRLFFGAAAILLGVVLCWLVTVVARGRIGRKALQRALALLQARVDTLRSAANLAYPSTVGIELTAFRQALSEVEGGLSEADTRLPPSLPLPGQGQWPDAEWFRGEVTRLDTVLDGLDAIMAHGLHPAGRMLAAKPGDARILAAIADIDAKAAEAGTQLLPELIAALRAIVAGARTSEGVRMLDADPPASGIALVRKLDFEISLLGAASWWVILVVTVLVGMLVLLLPNKGFGQWEDYVTCLLWGFGLPVTGGQLTSLGTDSVRTAFSLTRPD